MNLWRDIFESLVEALLLISPRLELKAINPAAQTMLGISKPTRKALTNLIGGNPWLRRMVEACVSGGQTLHNGEAALRLANRSPLEVSVRASPLIDRQGQVRGAIVLLNDRPHRRNVDRAFETSGENLGLSVVGLAHEIKNPLTGIKGATELLARMFSSDPRARQYCEIILNGVSRLAGLVEQAMALSGPEPIRLAPANIHKVLHQALAMAGLWPTAPALTALELIFDPSLPPVLADPAALERVFLNLLMNARDAIGERGIIRVLTRMETEFHLTSGGRRRRFLRVEVSDSGKGLSREQIDHLFTPFFTTKPNGTGLGLVLSKRIVNLHGGSLWAEPGSGFSRPFDRVEIEPCRAEARLSGLTLKVLLPVVGQDIDEASVRKEHGTPRRTRDKTDLSSARFKFGV